MVNPARAANAVAYGFGFCSPLSNRCPTPAETSVNAANSLPNPMKRQTGLRSRYNRTGSDGSMSVGSCWGVCIWAVTIGFPRFPSNNLFLPSKILLNRDIALTGYQSPEDPPFPARDRVGQFGRSIIFNLRQSEGFAGRVLAHRICPDRLRWSTSAAPQTSRRASPGALFCWSIGFLLSNRRHGRCMRPGFNSLCQNHGDRLTIFSAKRRKRRIVAPEKYDRPIPVSVDQVPIKTPSLHRHKARFDVVSRKLGRPGRIDKRLSDGGSHGELRRTTTCGGRHRDLWRETAGPLAGDTGRSTRAGVRVATLGRPSTVSRRLGN